MGFWRESNQDTYRKKGGYASPEEPVTQMPKVPSGPAPGAKTRRVPVDHPLVAEVIAAANALTVEEMGDLMGKHPRLYFAACHLSARADAEASVSRHLANRPTDA
jgi:hypothetical protein